MAPAALLLVACGEGPTDPSAARITLDLFGDSVVYVLPGSSLTEPLGVFVSVEGQPARGIAVEWSVTEGTVQLGSDRSVTGSDGVATMVASAGAAGTARVRVRTSRLDTGRFFTIHTVAVPVVTNVAPAAAATGSTMTVSITGLGVPEDAVVTFDGVRGRVLQASAAQLLVEVPACLEPGPARLRVSLGSVSSPDVVVSVLAGAVAPAYLDLVPGESRRFVTGAELSCIRIAHAPGAQYLVTLHNTDAIERPPLYLEFRGSAPAPPSAAPRAHAPFAEAWETALRIRERGFGVDGAAGASLVLAAVPVVGDRRTFSVLNAQSGFTGISATARLVSSRAAFYVDDESTDAFTMAELQRFAELFDGPIHDATTSAFGAPSDIDGNERIIVLFTPRVNALTPRGESSFISGFFYSCDLMSRSRCSGSNRAEVFYAMVPDPAATWGDARSAADVVASVPPILAHEFQHMIHFARRGFTSDVLWLSEALAHTAEDLAADALEAAGDDATAASFRAPNLRRAHAYLMGPQFTSVVSAASPPSLEQRGAGWLFLRYIREQHGAGGLLARMTASTRTGAGNVAAETGESWETLSADFGVALWSAAGDETAAPLAARLRFGAFDLRAGLATVAPGFELRPLDIGWSEAAGGGTHRAASSSHLLLTAPADALPLSTVLSGRRGADVPAAAAMTLSRIR
jgi:hypothetical protein